MRPSPPANPLSTSLAWLVALTLATPPLAAEPSSDDLIRRDRRHAGDHDVVRAAAMKVRHLLLATARGCAHGVKPIPSLTLGLF